MWMINLCFNLNISMKVIKNHIEDLVMVNGMVHGSEDPDEYIRVLHSDRSHLRIDY